MSSFSPPTLPSEGRALTLDDLAFGILEKNQNAKNLDIPIWSARCSVCQRILSTAHARDSSRSPYGGEISVARAYHFTVPLNSPINESKAHSEEDQAVIKAWNAKQKITSHCYSMLTFRGFDIFGGMTHDEVMKLCKCPCANVLDPVPEPTILKGRTFFPSKEVDTRKLKVEQIVSLPTEVSKIEDLEERVKKLKRNCEEWQMVSAKKAQWWDQIPEQSRTYLEKRLGRKIAAGVLPPVFERMVVKLFKEKDDFGVNDLDNLVRDYQFHPPKSFEISAENAKRIRITQELASDAQLPGYYKDYLSHFPNLEDGIRHLTSTKFTSAEALRKRMPPLETRWAYILHKCTMSLDDVEKAWKLIGGTGKPHDNFGKWVSTIKAGELEKLRTNGLITQSNWSVFSDLKFSNTSQFLKVVNKLKCDIPDQVVWTQEYKSFFNTHNKGQKVSFKFRPWVVKLLNSTTEESKLATLLSALKNKTLKPSKKEISPKGKGKGAAKGGKTKTSGRKPAGNVPLPQPASNTPPVLAPKQVRPTYADASVSGLLHQILGRLAAAGI